MKTLVLLLTFCLVGSIKVERLSLIAQGSTRTTTTCMGVCECDSADGLVRCSDLGLKTIPETIPTFVKTLVLSRNEITAIRENDFVGLSSLEVIYLDDNHISHVDENSFEGLPVLKDIYLANNKIDSWSSNIIRPLADTLETLDLSMNELSEITSTMFNYPMLKLQKLILEVCALHGIEDFSFAQLSALKSLSLKQNLINELNSDGNTLEGLEVLEELFFDFNFFSLLPEASAFRHVKDSLRTLSFAGQQRTNSVPPLEFTNMETFNLSFCSIDTLQNMTFVGIPKLLTLDISGNSLSSIESHAFYGLEALQTLYLSQNNFQLLPYRSLMLVSNSLESLYADYLPIRRITEEPFEDDGLLLSKLSFLSLHTSYISRVDENSFFQNLRSLKELVLSNSQLAEVPKAALAHLVSLEDLTFNQNLITRLSDDSFPHLPSLLHLAIDDSSLLTLVEDNAFQSFENLLTLTITGGSLQSLSRNALADLTQLTHLILSNNKLKTPFSEWAQGKTLRAFLLADNLWDCDCLATDFQQFLLSKTYADISTTDSITCHYPRFLRNTLIADVNSNDLSCEVSDCPKECLCFIQDVENDESSTALNAVDCSDEDLEDVPTSLPPSTLLFSMNADKLTSLSKENFKTIINTQQLFLSNNEIESIENETFSLLVDLVELDMHSNRIYSLPDGLFDKLTKLQTLRLDHNRLETVGTFQFSELQKLELLDLSHNNLAVISSNAFSNLKSVQSLVLSYNYISVIEKNALCSLESLQNLYLFHNYVYNWDENMLECNKFLETLDIGGNSMDEINFAFLNSASVSYLKMENGKLKEIKDFGFSGFPNLKTLRLSNNYITNDGLSDFAFMSSSDSQAADSLLTSLDLGSNRLTEFPLKAFEPLNSLQALYLNENPINNLHAAAEPSSPYLPRLISLQLANTEISVVNTSSVFQFIPTLESLVMNNCKLSKVPSNILSVLPELNTLILDSNPITEISESDFPLHSYLQSFSLRFDDKLTQINERAFSNLPGLSSLQLSGGGSLSLIDKSAFNKLEQIKSLDMSDNNLSTPIKEWFNSFSPDVLESVSMNDNPWQCDCDAFPYKQWLSNEAEAFTAYSLSVICDEPIYIKGSHIEDVSDSFVCDTPDTTTQPTTQATRTQADEVDTTTGGSNKISVSVALLLGSVFSMLMF